jgi:hypothetical protein
MNTGSEDMNVVCVLCLGVILSLALIVFVLVLVLVLVLVVVLFFLELAVEEVDIAEVCRLAARVEIARPEQDPVVRGQHERRIVAQIWRQDGSANGP